MGKRAVRRQLVIDVNRDGSIAGGFWRSDMEFVEEIDGEESITPLGKVEEYVQDWEEAEAYLAAGIGTALADKNAVHEKLAQEREAWAAKEAALKAALNEGERARVKLGEEADEKLGLVKSEKAQLEHLLADREARLRGLIDAVKQAQIPPVEEPSE